MSNLDRIRSLASELTDPRMHIERGHVWDKNRNKKRVEHKTTQAGLLHQLYVAAVDPVKLLDDVGGVTGKPQSRPPLALEAMSRYLEISEKVRGWLNSLGQPKTETVEGDIRALAGAGYLLDSDTLDAIEQDFKMWRRWAAVMTGWECRTFVPRIECPVCFSEQSIRINPMIFEGFCAECQHYWVGDEDIVSLGKNAQEVAA